MELYDWLLLVHILAAIIWVGGGLYNGALMGSIAGSGSDEEITTTYLKLGRVNNVMFPVASLVLVIAAIWMIVENDAWTFSQTWVTLAFTLWVVTTAIGPAFYAPQTRKAASLVAADGAASAEARGVVKRIGMVSRIDGLILLTILFLMIWKPGV